MAVDYKTYSNEQLQEVFQSTMKKKLFVDVLFLAISFIAIMIVAFGQSTIWAGLLVVAGFFMKFKATPRQYMAIQSEVRRRKELKK